MKRNSFVVGLLVCVVIMIGCVPSFLKPSYNNVAECWQCENSLLTYEIGADLVEKTPDELYATINAVHLELVVDLSREAGSAAGFIVKLDGKPYILTAGHINTTAVKYRAIYAYFSQGQKRPEEVEIVVADHYLDFALLRFKNPNFIYSGPYVRIGSAKNLKTGQKVYAIGSPLGFRFHLSEGIIGKIEQGMDHDGILQPEIIMHGAVLNPGNSGGPLLDRFGHVVGINVMGINGGFSPFRPSVVTTMPVAIPIDDVITVLKRSKSAGVVKHSYLGLKLWDSEDLNPLDYEQREVPVPDRDGLIVFLMAKNSPAEKAGLQKGDLILECDGRPYEKSNEIAKRALFETMPGTEMEFKVLRMYSASPNVETGKDGKAVYKTLYKKLAEPKVLTIKVKPDVR